MSGKSVQADLIAIPSEEELKWASLRRSKNPYYYYELFGCEDASPATSAISAVNDIQPRPQEEGISKKVFESGCRRIFLQYVPPAEVQTIPREHRDFILRNEQRSPLERLRLLEALSRYDLSTSGNLKPHLNREGGLLTASKLKRIEEAVLKTHPDVSGDLP